MEEAMRTLVDLVRLRLGVTLQAWALRILPTWSPERIGASRGLREQSEYERYSGYCQILKTPVLPFVRWREQWRWQQRKQAAA
jgi:hypothetical protein